ncbi:MAG TPA: LPS export ABC transporter ATP-binding protein, partial [Xanthobacteraceae bacterium]|nr:LPS export ABC transporter ATP-binding protein [Xanthobacteraceae bacterium]
MFDSLFGRNPRRQGQSTSSFWRIDLRSLGGPITALARVALNLPQKSPKPRREDATRPAPGEQRPRPQQREPRRDHPQQAAHPQHDYDQQDYEQRDPRQQTDYPPHGYQQHGDQQGGYEQYAPADPRQGHQEYHQHDRQQDHRPAMTQPQRGDNFLSVRGVEKSFGKRKVVKGVDLYVRRGEAVGLLGPNGAGKTTVFYMITGLIKSDRGRVDLDGFNISALPMYQRARLGIGYLPQEASIFRGLTVEDNIRSVLEIVEPNRKKREAELNNLLEEFHITRLRKSPAIALSGGERRRVEIARALASRPNYMLLDEPFAGIDPIAVGDIQALVRHLTSRGIGVLITDHNVRETLGLTDRAYI